MTKVPDLEPIPFWEMVGFMEKRFVVPPDIYYGQMYGIQRANAFSVAGISAVKMLERIKFSLVDAIADGTSYEEWKNQVMKGEFDVDLPEWRYEVIYRTNIQSMYNRGRQAEQRENADYEPYLMYDAVGDSRTRPSHLEMDGVIRSINDPWWDTHAPPNGYNCRCHTIGLSEDEMMERGGITPSLPDAEPDEEWDYSTLLQPHRGIESSVKRAMKDTPKAGRFLPKPPPTLKEIRAIGARELETYRAYINSGLDWHEGELAYWKKQRSNHAKWLEYFKKKFGGRAFSKVSGFTNNLNGRAGAAAIKGVSEYFPKEWIEMAEKQRKGLRAGHTLKRGYFVANEVVKRPRWFDKRKSVQKALAKGFDLIEGDATSHSTFVHEFSHFLQRCFPDLQQYFVQMHQFRVGDEKQSVFRSNRDGSKERGRKDKYPHWYFGKEYANESPLELLTMVFESILSTDALFTEAVFEDDELAELGLGLLFGWRPQ